MILWIFRCDKWQNGQWYSCNHENYFQKYIITGILRHIKTDFQNWTICKIYCYETWGKGSIFSVPMTYKKLLCTCSLNQYFIPRNKSILSLINIRQQKNKCTDTCWSCQSYSLLLVRPAKTHVYVHKYTQVFTYVAGTSMRIHFNAVVPNIKKYYCT